MKNHYEALLVLNSQGKEDTIKEIIDRLESEFQKKAPKSNTCKKWTSTSFHTWLGPLDAGYYVNFIFSAILS